MWPISLAALVVGLTGFWILRRDRVRIAPLVMTTVIALVTYGNSRFRTASEPVLLIGVAVVAVHVWTRYRPSPVGEGQPN